MDGLSSADTLLAEIDLLIRARKLDDVLELVDEVVLRKGLGLDYPEIRSLRLGARRLRGRRYSRRKEPRR
jgi:hypothetical protein